MECENCGHDEADHVINDDGTTTCEGDGLTEGGEPFCTCTEFEEPEEEEED